MSEVSTFFCKPVSLSNKDKIVEYVLDKYINVIDAPLKESHQPPIPLDFDDIRFIGNLLKGRFDIKIFNGLIFTSRPYEKQVIHVDATVRSHGYYTALNIPILNCEHGLMTWLSGDFVEKTLFLPNGINYNKIDLENSKLVPVYEKNINTPHIVRTDVPHYVTNNSPQLRIMLSLRFKENLDLPPILNEL
jgi:hypothetical protein